MFFKKRSFDADGEPLPPSEARSVGLIVVVVSVGSLLFWVAVMGVVWALYFT